MKPALKHGKQAEDGDKQTSDARKATFVDIPQRICSNLVQLMSCIMIVYRAWWTCSTDIPLMSVRKVIRVPVTTVCLHGNRLMAIQRAGTASAVVAGKRRWYEGSEKACSFMGYMHESF
jgi:hypothetical protein